MTDQPGTLTRRRLRHRMVVANGSVLLRTELIPLSGSRRAGGSARGEVTGFSRKSRARMMYRCSTLDLQELVELKRGPVPEGAIFAGARSSSTGTPEMLTFTYPERFPMSGATAKAHLHAFRKRFYRRFGVRMAGIWKMEFQARGAPHFHCYIGRPTSIGWKPFVEWARQAWYEIVGSGDPKHARQGVRIDRQFVGRATNVRRLAAYFAKHNAKQAEHYQHRVPEGFIATGRFWGVWVLKPHQVEVGLTTDQLIEFRRTLVRLRRSQGGKCKAPSRLIGLWVLSHNGFKLADQLLGVHVGLTTRTPTSTPLALARPG